MAFLYRFICKLLSFIGLIKKAKIDTPSRTNEAWKIKSNPLLIDIYFKSPIDWDKMQTDKRLVGIIHKASGFDDDMIEDPEYKKRRKIAKERGYLWGSYHRGMAGDPIKQAKTYLDIIGDMEGELMALDLEDTEDPKYMSNEATKAFIDYIFKETGRWPFIYGNQNVTKILSETFPKNPSFCKTKLWYAWPHPKIQTSPPSSRLTFPTDIWPTYTLWQFSSERNCSEHGPCPYRIPGTKYDIDVNLFYGSHEELKKIWAQ